MDVAALILFLVAAVLAVGAWKGLVPATACAVVVALICQFTHLTGHVIR